MHHRDTEIKKEIDRLALRRVIAKLWTSETDCSPIDFCRQKYTFFNIQTLFGDFFISPSSVCFPHSTNTSANKKHLPATIYKSTTYTPPESMRNRTFFVTIQAYISLGDYTIKNYE